MGTNKKVPKTIHLPLQTKNYHIRPQKPQILQCGKCKRSFQTKTF